MYVLFFSNVDYSIAVFGSATTTDNKNLSQTLTETTCYSSTFLSLHFSVTVCGTQYPNMLLSLQMS